MSHSNVGSGFKFSQEGYSQNTFSMGGASSAPHGLKFALAGSACGFLGSERRRSRAVALGWEQPVTGPAVPSAGLSAQRRTLMPEIALGSLPRLSVTGVFSRN